MKNRLLMLAGALALLAVIGKFYAVPLYAQVRAAITQDRDAPARNPFQDHLWNHTGTSPCQVIFGNVPAGKRLVIQQVSVLATYDLGGASGPADIELRGAGVFQFLPITPAPNNYGAETQFTAHAGVLAYYEAGQAPEVDVFTPNSNPLQVLASISGYTIDVP